MQQFNLPKNLALITTTGTVDNVDDTHSFIGMTNSSDFSVFDRPTSDVEIPHAVEYTNENFELDVLEVYNDRPSGDRKVTSVRVLTDGTDETHDMYTTYHEFSREMTYRYALQALGECVAEFEYNRDAIIDLCIKEMPDTTIEDWLKALDTKDTIDVVLDVDRLEAIKVQFKKHGDGCDSFIEKGMTAWLTDVSIVYDGDTPLHYTLNFDFEEFEDVNKKYFKKVFHSNAGSDTLVTAYEAGMYTHKLELHIGDLEDSTFDNEQHILSLLKVIR